MNKINLSLIICLCFYALLSVAEEESGLVEVHYPENPTLSYKERRKTFGFVFGFSQTKFLPTQYNSLIENVEYGLIFGDDVIPMNQAEVGVKWNHQLGSFVLSAIYGLGHVSGNYLGLERKMSLKKNSAELTLALDNLFEEPYVVPYGSFIGSIYNIEDRDSLGSIFKTTSPIYGFRWGLLLQLNWLDSDTATAGRIASGIENTYLDVYFSQNGSMTNNMDPNLVSDMNFGAGLRLEF